MESIKVLCLLIPLFNVAWGSVPMLLWESTKSDSVMSFPALDSLSKEDVEQYLLKKINLKPSPLIVLFTDETLSMEDFSWRDSEGRGNFEYLEKITENSPVEFHTSVRDPVEAMKDITKNKYPVQYLDIEKNDLATMVDDRCGKIFTVKLSEPKSDEDRAQLLRRHDSTMADTYSKLVSKCSHVIGIYTGIRSSWVVREEVRRLRREIDSGNTSSSSTAGPEPSNIPSSSNSPVTPDGKVLYLEGQGLAMVFSDSFPKLRVNKEETVLGDTKATTISADSSKMGNIKLQVRYNDNKKTLSFNFDNTTWYGYWNLKSITLDNNTEPPSTLILKPSIELYAPIGQSFHSGSPVKFTNGSVTLEFSTLQLQPFFLNKPSKSFGEAVDAVTFFTPAIWSGIFVTFLLILIFTWGITMIMDIRTMDQFDDPKGKTITVSNTD